MCARAGSQSSADSFSKRWRLKFYPCLNRIVAVTVRDVGKAVIARSVRAAFHHSAGHCPRTVNDLPGIQWAGICCASEIIRKQRRWLNRNCDRCRRGVALAVVGSISEGIYAKKSTVRYVSKTAIVSQDERPIGRPAPENRREIVSIRICIIRQHARCWNGQSRIDQPNRSEER